MTRSKLRGVRVTRKVADSTAMIPAGPCPRSVATVEQPVADDDVLRNNLARRLREAYIRERRRHYFSTTGRESSYGSKSIPTWDGGFNEDSGTVRKAIWPEIADILIAKRQLAPERFVQAQFDGAKPPNPSQLKSDAAWDKFVTIDRDSVSRLKFLFGSYSQIFRGACYDVSLRYPHLDSREQWHRVLQDEHSELPVLFRYCISMAENFGDLSQLFFPYALEEYLQDSQGYDHAWGAALPQYLRDQGQLLLDSYERTPHGR